MELKIVIVLLTGFMFFTDLMSAADWTQELLENSTRHNLQAPPVEILNFDQYETLSRMDNEYHELEGQTAECLSCKVTSYLLLSSLCCYLGLCDGAIMAQNSALLIVQQNSAIAPLCLDYIRGMILVGSCASSLGVLGSYGNLRYELRTGAARLAQEEIIGQIRADFRKEQVIYYFNEEKCCLVPSSFKGRVLAAYNAQIDR